MHELALTTQHIIRETAVPFECNIIFNNMAPPTACLEWSLLEVWGSEGSYEATEEALNNLISYSFVSLNTEQA